MRNELAGNTEREVLGSEGKLRTYNSELGKAADSELVHAASHGGHEADEQSTSVIGLRRKNSMARIHA
jgi:hypothetical protein